MLKKILSGLVMFCIILSLCACGNSNTNNNDNTDVTVIDDNTDVTVIDDNTDVTVIEENIKHSGEKIKGTITRGLVFSEGLAFVCLDGNNEKVYCINKEGYIVFEAEERLFMYDRAKFMNGIALVNGNIYDTTGKCITPESVGATKFYRVALEGGYILATKITADYSSSKKELGVLNKEFKWILEPNEELYKALEDQLHHLEAVNSNSFYFNDYICFQDEKSIPAPSNVAKYLNINTGELTETASFEIPSYGLFFGGFTYKDYQDNIIIDLSKHNNIEYVRDNHDDGNFKDNKAPVFFNNKDAGRYYFTFINEKGEFLFEPKEIKNMTTVESFCFDGEYLLIVDSLSAKHIQCYNIKGELLGELKTETLGRNRSYSCYINNGVIYVESSYKGYYFSTDFKELF